MASPESFDRTLQLGNSLVTIGRFTYGTEHLTVREWGEGAALTIGSFCSISSNALVFLGGNHRLDWVTTFPLGHISVDDLGGEGIVGHPATAGDVTVGHDVWFGHGVTIMSGITIGTGAVLAANAHIVKDVEPYSIVGGNPAKHIAYRFDAETVRLLRASRWWDWPVETIRERATQLSAAPDPAVLRRWIVGDA